MCNRSSMKPSIQSRWNFSVEAVRLEIPFYNRSGCHDAALSDNGSGQHRNVRTKLGTVAVYDILADYRAGAAGRVGVAMLRRNKSAPVCSCNVSSNVHCPPVVINFATRVEIRTDPHRKTVGLDEAIWVNPRILPPHHNLRIRLWSLPTTNGLMHIPLTDQADALVAILIILNHTPFDTDSPR